MITHHNVALTHSAELSGCGTYRYRLRRVLERPGSVLEPPVRPLVVVMLNPSTADAVDDDATIRTLMGYGRRWLFTDLLVANLFALRSTDPGALLTHLFPVGPENDEVLRTLPAGPVVVAFGGHRAVADRLPRVLELLGDRELVCLGTTKAGMPRHPLRIAHATRLVPWRMP